MENKEQCATYVLTTRKRDTEREVAKPLAVGDAALTQGLVPSNPGTALALGTACGHEEAHITHHDRVLSLGSDGVL